MAKQIYFRVDPRLLHATVLEGWVPRLGVKRVLVLDTQVTADVRRKTILEMSARDEVAVTFAQPPKGVEALDSLPDEKILVLFCHLQAAAEFFSVFKQEALLNLGHLPRSEASSELHPAVHLDANELELVDSLFKLSVTISVVPLVSDPMQYLVVSGKGQAHLQAEPMSQQGQGEKAMKAEAEVEIVNERGLHLRAAHVLAQLAGSLPVSVKVGRKGRMVNAKSLLGITTLGAAFGTKIKIETEGEGAEEALQQVVELVASGFKEGAI